MISGSSSTECLARNFPPIQSAAGFTGKPTFKLRVGFSVIRQFANGLGGFLSQRMLLGAPSQSLVRFWSFNGMHWPFTMSAEN
jgi:hypothetical protein